MQEILCNLSIVPGTLMLTIRLFVSAIGTNEKEPEQFGGRLLQIIVRQSGKILESVVPLSNYASVSHVLYLMHIVLFAAESDLPVLALPGLLFRLDLVEDTGEVVQLHAVRFELLLLQRVQFAERASPKAAKSS